MKCESEFDNDEIVRIQDEFKRMKGMPTTSVEIGEHVIQCVLSVFNKS